jgi:hypothetical protein
MFLKKKDDVRCYCGKAALVRRASSRTMRFL